ncbi:MAG: twin arginine-targeting protein translocase [Thermocladium sp. ECH_B]|nr:MAG: twin arginine-targeting protein translocase [Thermocladium sp. ECH_B]
MLGSIWDWIILIAVVLVLFGGAGKLPEIFRSLGRAVGEFKKGQIEVENELRQLTQTNPAPGTSNQEKKPEQGENVEELKKKIEELQRQLDELKKGK